MAVAELDRRRIAASAVALARAFADNPSTLALIPGEAKARERKLGRVMRGFVEAARGSGTARIVCDGDAVRGAMLAFGPHDLPLGRLAYAWLSYGPLCAGPRTAYRYALADQYLRQLHPRHPHWYLFVLGVDPAAQGKGFGSLLLRELTARADRDRLPCYLETDKTSSVRLYERHGFSVEREETEPRLGIHFWTMTRKSPF